MKPIRSVEVAPFVPEPLECLRELAYNLRWTWDHETINLFRRLDRELWEVTGHNPVLMLGTISQERLEEAASDDGFLGQLNRACAAYHEYMRAENTWYEKHYRQKQKVKTEMQRSEERRQSRDERSGYTAEEARDEADGADNIIAYFSAEFGLTESLPIYSGGLGILAGDHVKAASELGLPLVGVGIVYQQGYFRQYLNPDGWQQERYPINDFYNLPIVPVKKENGDPVLIPLDFPGRIVYARIWKAQVGRVPLYMLDTNVSENSQQDQDITDALYHGDSDLRIKQEIVLGIGGMRALKALGIEPVVCHMNEGHSAFLGLERIFMLMEEKGYGFAEAKELAAGGQVFTTHTAVPAGIDRFPPELLDRYFSEYYRKAGISRDEFLSLGRSDESDANEPFSMAMLAINLSARTNAVSRLHGDVSRKLFGAAWKELPEHEVPITHITNGIHTRSWISQEMCELYDRYLGPRWSEDIGDVNVWRRVEDIPDEELWRIHERRRQRLVNFCRTRMRKQLEQRGALASELKEALEILNPDALTIGFARRMATYKRATLLLKDEERLAAILNNKKRPVQIIIAGKAHPDDVPAKELIRQLMHFSRKEEVKRRFVFLEDYDMNVARWMLEGVDVWLNTPRRFLEACGTSGMKVAFNGGINVSILDGWWDEAYEPHAGWAIGHGEVYADNAYQDEVESAALYDLLEKEIIPTFYDRDKEGLPRSWLHRMKASMLDICPVFNVNRMVRDYATRMYFPAATRYTEFLSDDAAKAKALALWKMKLRRTWKDVGIESVEADALDKLQVGDDMRVRAAVNLGGLSADDVAVQIYHGPIDSSGNINRGEVITMTLTSEKNGMGLFSGAIRYFKSGRHGFTVRVIPHHDDLNSPFETGLLHWASDRVHVKA